MDVIQAARQLGKSIQADERYKRISLAQDKNDADTGLQEAISAFNAKRAQLNNEVKREDKDQEAIKAMDTELKRMYSDIFKNPNMIEFTEAKRGMEEMISQVNRIVGGSASGQDPDLIDPFAEDCGGDCSGCAGCR